MRSLLMSSGCVLLSFIFSIPLLRAQRSGRSAIVVTRQNDTLRVWLAVISNRSIQFKRDAPGANSETLPAFAIRMLTTADGSRYIGAVVLVDRTPVNVEVTRTLDSSFLRLAPDTVLLMAEYLSPKMDLYSLADRDKLHFFVDAPDVPLTELYHRKFRDQNMLEQEDQEYIRQLQRWMSDCPDVAGGLVDLAFTPGALKKAVRSYNSQCGQHTGATYENSGKKAKLQIAALAGGFDPGITVTTSATGGSPFNITQPMRSRNGVTGGLDLEYSLAGSGAKLSIAGTLLFNRANAAESEYPEYGSPSNYTLRTLTIDYSSLRIDLLARYTFPGGRVVPFVNGGLVFGAVISANNSMVVDEYYDNAHHVSSTDPFGAGFKRFQTGFAAGAGIRYRRLGLEYRFGEILNVVFIEGTDVHLSEQQLCLTFRLNR